MNKSKSPITLVYMPDELKLKDSIKKNDGWWATIFAAPIANKMLYYLVDIKGICPNHLTLFSLLLGLLAAFCFFIHSITAMICGAILIQVSFIFDCMDGQLARYNGSSSNFGAWLDRISDRIKDFSYCFFLALGWFLKYREFEFSPINLTSIQLIFEPWMIWPLSMISSFSLYLIDYYVNQDMKLEKKEQVFSKSDEFQKKIFLMVILRKIMKFGLMVYKKIPILRFNIGEQALLLTLFTVFQCTLGLFIFFSFLGVFYCFYWPFAKIQGYTLDKK